METTVSRDQEASRFEIYDGETRAGYIDYRASGEELALLHTEVDGAYEGAGVGSKLTRYALDDAHERGLDVLPHCPFVRDWISRHPDYIALVPREQRAQFDL